MRKESMPPTDRRWDTERREWVYPGDWRGIETAPKDGTRILGYGVLALESENGIGTVKWESWYHNWVCDPNEATETGPESCVLTHWQPLPEPPNV